MRGIHSSISGRATPVQSSIVYLLILVFSLSVMPAKIIATESEGGGEFVEQSSPEELNIESQRTHPTSDSPFGRVGSSLPTPSALQNASSATPGGSPLLTQGVFPYQANPIAAVVAAGLTLTFMTMKEMGKVDVDGILFLLNSTDFYAGLAGSVAGARGQKFTSGILASIGKGAQKLAPQMLTPLAQSEAFQVVTNILNGFSYTVSVSAGYEIFSQFWKIATKNIPEAHTMTGFMSAPGHVQKRVLLNLLYYTMMDKGLQKKIWDSIQYHRIMTFEFIAMNVGLYVGAQLGNFLAQKYAPGNPWAKSLGPVAGSVVGGILVQMMPNSWKEYFNGELLDYKISRVRSRLASEMYTLQEGIKDFYYPAESMEGTASYWSKGIDLSADIERVFRSRDLLASLTLQYTIANPQNVNQLWSPVAEVQTVVSDFFDVQLDHLKKPAPELSQQMAQWIAENRSPQEIQRLSARQYKTDPKISYYWILLDEARERAEAGVQEVTGLQEFFESDSNK